MPTMTKMIIFQTFPYRLRSDGYGNTADKRGSFLEYISTKRVSMQKLLVFIKMKWIKIEENRNRKKNGDSAGVFRGYCHYSLMSMMRLRLIVTVLRYVRKCCTVQCSAAEASMTFHYLEKRQGFVHATNRWPFSSQWQ